jgi:hypothetical protein
MAAACIRFNDSSDLEGSSMPRLAPFICLLIALSAPLLTHAQAAEDLERILVELLEPGELETPDGGVGDEPIIASVWRAVPILDLVQLAMPACEGFTDVASLDLPPRDRSLLRLCRRGDPWLFPETSQRQSWLQHFLI